MEADGLGVDDDDCISLDDDDEEEDEELDEELLLLMLLGREDDEAGAELDDIGGALDESRPDEVDVAPLVLGSNNFRRGTTLDEGKTDLVLEMVAEDEAVRLEFAPTHEVEVPAWIGTCWL